MNPYTYDSQKQQRPLVNWLLRLCLIAGCLYTGTHNYALYLRGLSEALAPGRRQAVAFAIAFLLEAAFYFSVEGRGRVFVTNEQRTASAAGATALFFIIAINTITDHAMNLHRVGAGDWLESWATYGAAAAIVAVVGYIGYLKAHAPEAQLAAAAATAEAARVHARVSAQRDILADSKVQAAFADEARRWALRDLPHIALPPVAASPVLPERDADRRQRPNA